jgi:hypothetical protein
MGAPYVLSTAAVALFATNPSLTFLLEYEDAPPASVDVDLRYRIGFLAAHGRGGAPWLQLVRPVTRQLGRATIPIPVREHPSPPSLGEHHVELPPIGKGPVLEQLFDARRWNYGFAYARSSAPQDNQLSASVRYQGAPEQGSALPIRHDGSFDALAEALVVFEMIRVSVSEMLDRLPLVDTNTPEPELDGIAAALELVHYSVLRIAAAFQSHAEPTPFTEPAGRPDGERLDIIDVIGGELGIRVSPDSSSIAEGVGIAAASVDGHAGRVVTLSGLDILQSQSACASLTQHRNRTLLGSPGQYDTSKEFVYASRPSSFHGDVVASRWAGDEGFDLAGLVPEPRTVASVLSALFGTFFRALDGTRSEVSSECRLSLSCSYEFDVILAQDGAPPFVTQLPILQLHAVTLRRSEAAQFGQELAARIEQWMTDRSASETNARLLFEVKILVPTVPGEGDTIALQLRNLALAV